MPSKRSANSVEEAGMAEGRERSQTDSVDEAKAPAKGNEANAAETNYDALSDEQRAFLEEASDAGEVIQVKMNPSLGVSAPHKVDIDGKVFYSDPGLQRAEGTTEISEKEYEAISGVKESETGLQYIVKA